MNGSNIRSSERGIDADAGVDHLERTTVGAARAPARVTRTAIDALAR